MDLASLRPGPALRMRLISMCAALAASVAAAAPAAAAPPDTPGHTPPAVAAEIRATKAVSAPALRRRLARMMRCGACGGFVYDLLANRTLFARADRVGRALASNMKLFTTGAAFDRFGPEGTLATETWTAVPPDANGVVAGNLILRGGGDPTLGGADLRRLAALVGRAGIERVTGRLIFDSSFLDGRPSVPQHGIRAESLGGPLSGLYCTCGQARSAARIFARALRRRGIAIHGPKPGRLVPSAGRTLIADVASPEIEDIAEATNEPSNNFLAEMLVKDLGKRFGGFGSTRRGIAVIRSTAQRFGSRVVAENGSGLSTRDRATPRAVVALLRGLYLDEEVRKPFIESLAAAGREGTLHDRMEGTAAEGRCHGKTGTLDAVSALSGYCLVAGRAVAFSFLMNRTDVFAARVLQDRMTALIARYR